MVSTRRLFGLDRSGPAPPQTRRGQRLRPLTIPNLVGYLRLAGIPVFLYLALSSDDGRTAASAILYLAISAGDYLDGFLARVTGQYSRMGALLDPVIDRLTILAGVVVCWRFELLPRWALAVLLAREVFMLIAVLGALRLGLDLHINWIGRIAVWPTMGAVGSVLLGWETLGEVLLYLGLAGSIAASVQYGRDALREIRAPAKLQ